MSERFAQVFVFICLRFQTVMSQFSKLESLNLSPKISKISEYRKILKGPSIEYFEINNYNRQHHKEARTFEIFHAHVTLS